MTFTKQDNTKYLDYNLLIFLLRPTLKNHPHNVLSDKIGDIFPKEDKSVCYIPPKREGPRKQTKRSNTDEDFSLDDKESKQLI